MMTWYEVSEGANRRAWFLITGILVLTGIGTARLIVGGTRGEEIATDVAVPLGVLGLLAAVIGVKGSPKSG